MSSDRPKQTARRNATPPSGNKAPARDQAAGIAADKPDSTSAARPRSIPASVSLLLPLAQPVTIATCRLDIKLTLPAAEVLRCLTDGLIARGARLRSTPARAVVANPSGAAIWLFEEVAIAAGLLVPSPDGQDWHHRPEVFAAAARDAANREGVRLPTAGFSTDEVDRLTREDSARDLGERLLDRLHGIDTQHSAGERGLDCGAGQRGATAARPPRRLTRRRSGSAARRRVHNRAVGARRRPRVLERFRREPSTARALPPSAVAALTPRKATPRRYWDDPSPYWDNPPRASSSTTRPNAKPPPTPRADSATNRSRIAGRRRGADEAHRTRSMTTNRPR